MKDDPAPPRLPPPAGRAADPRSPSLRQFPPSHRTRAQYIYMFYIGPDLCAREGGFLRVELSLISAYYCGTWNRQDASLSEHPVCALVLQPPVQAHARRSRGREGREGSGEL